MPASWPWTFSCAPSTEAGHSLYYLRGDETKEVGMHTPWVPVMAFLGLQDRYWVIIIVVIIIIVALGFWARNRPA